MSRKRSADIYKKMFPQNHVLTSCAAVSIYTLAFDLDIWTSSLWLILAAASTVLIDLDHLILQYFIPGRRHVVVEILKNPIRYMNIKSLRDRLHYTGFGLIRGYAHLLETFFLAFFLIEFNIPYGLPIIVSLLTHTLADSLQSLFYRNHR